MVSFQAHLVVAMARVVRVKRSLGVARLERTIVADRKNGPTEPSKAFQRRFSVERSGSVYVVKPKGDASSHHVLYFHGGGFVLSITELHWNFVGKLVEKLRCAVTVPLYPLAPENKARDLFAAMLPLYHDLVEKVGAENLTVMGDSAGGNIALSLAMQADRRPGRLVLLSPGLDFTFTDPKQPALDRVDPILDLAGARKLGPMYVGDLDVRDPTVSPLFGSFDGLPPIAVFTGTRDITNADAHRIDATVYEYPGMVHVWMLFPMPEATRAIAQIASFVDGSAGEGAEPVATRGVA